MRVTCTVGYYLDGKGCNTRKKDNAASSNTSLSFWYHEFEGFSRPDTTLLRTVAFCSRVHLNQFSCRHQIHSLFVKMKPKSKKALQKGSWNRKEYAIIQSYKKMQRKSGKSLLPKQKHVKDNNNRKSFIQKAMVTYQEKRAIIEEQKRMREQERNRRKELHEKYLEKKKENFRKLSKRNKWGQPVMRGRLEILLDKIQSSVNDDSIKNN
ncbi:hypothetical protein TNIN_414221 [Trichonephila inaurata madagascariensis]|uniref:Uncharacterized protein n=1 Tax=Trichonephila inaurata madagascariensis TaxID=2747483 RepID=A0A8X7BQZ1_9ARAC|nr:hypothetical protein TNIN_414221 [Trichonephila inaurata madagascariensis]